MFIIQEDLVRVSNNIPNNIIIIYVRTLSTIINLVGAYRRIMYRNLSREHYLTELLDLISILIFVLLFI